MHFHDVRLQSPLHHYRRISEKDICVTHEKQENVLYNVMWIESFCEELFDYYGNFVRAHFELSFGICGLLMICLSNDKHSIGILLQCMRSLLHCNDTARSSQCQVSQSEN